MPRPYNPTRELESFLRDGNLRFAVAMAKDIRSETGRRIGSPLALKMLVLVSAQRPEEYDEWAIRWLARWLRQTRSATIDDAADICQGLAQIPVDEQAGLEKVNTVCRRLDLSWPRK
jgi:hypothetical protein